MWDHHPCYGEKYEPVAGPVINTGLFAAMIEAGDVMGVFVGHEHVNDFHGELLGIRLGYGRGTATVPTVREASRAAHAFTAYKRNRVSSTRGCASTTVPPWHNQPAPRAVRPPRTDRRGVTNGRSSVSGRDRSRGCFAFGSA